MIESRDAGLYCEAGNFYIDPWSPVERAVITHAHADHAHPGSQSYVAARDGEALLRARVGDGAFIQVAEYGERIAMGEVTVSLHPAGHILGSAQVRIERGGEVWGFSGDYKLAPDPTCAPFERLQCHTFVTESMFALPIYRWPAESEIAAEMLAWWRANREAGVTSVLFANPLGEAQRVLAMLGAMLSAADGAIYAHEAVERYSAIYRAQGIALRTMDEASPGALVVAPASAIGSQWLKQFGTISTAMASGWMRIRGTRRRRSLDRGFVLSDHADWPALLAAIDATQAEMVLATGGNRAALARWLTEHGRRAGVIETHFDGGEE